tara:strand:+ start:12317 stop:13042 length:726 start_codon:yes stop_codon:yes gene_type:complete
MVAVKVNLIIPTAGRGTRLGNLTVHNTKNMVNVLNKPIFEHQLKNIKLKLLNKIIFVIGHKAKKFKNYIKNLNLPVKVEFINNSNYKNSQCATSLLLALKKTDKPTIVLNSDLVLKEKVITSLFKNKNKDFFFIRKPLKNSKSRKVKVFIKKKKVIKIGINLKKFNFECVGPFIIQKKNIKELIYRGNLLKLKKLNKQSCYEFLGQTTKNINYSYKFINDGSWYEFNTKSDIKEFSKIKKF